MTGKLDLLWIGAKNRIRNLVEDFKTEEAGIAEMIGVLLLIVIVIAAAAIFQDKIKALVQKAWKGLNTDNGTSSSELFK